jgi:hypothetical protein
VVFDRTFRSFRSKRPNMADRRLSFPLFSPFSVAGRSFHEIKHFFLRIRQLSGDHLTRSTTTYDLREYSRPPANTIATLATSSRHLRPRRDLIAIGSLLTTTTPTIRRSLRTLPERCNNHQMRLDAFRYATLDGGSRGSLPQVRFLIQILFFYFVTRS